MANDCLVIAEVRHEDKRKFTEFLKTWETSDVFNTYHPIPEGEVEHTWCADNWGTTKEPYDKSFEDYSYSDEENETDNFVLLDFSTAWTPPTEFFIHLHEKHGFDVRMWYYESGSGMCGEICNTDYSHYNIHNISDLFVYESELENIIDKFPQIPEDHEEHWGNSTEESSDD